MEDPAAALQDLGLHHPTTVLDAINVAKVLTGVVIVALIATKGLGQRQAVYVGLHGSYLMWWLLEQWLFPPFSNRFSQPADPVIWGFVLLLVGLAYAWPAWCAWRNTAPVQPALVAISIMVFALGSLTNVMADVQMHATKAALAPTKTLVTTGIYRLARNPNYFADWLRYGCVRVRVCA